MKLAIPGDLFHKMRRLLLQWLGTAHDVINKVALDVMRENEGVEAPRKINQFTFHI